MRKVQHRTDTLRAFPAICIQNPTSTHYIPTTRTNPLEENAPAVARNSCRRTAWHTRAFFIKTHLKIRARCLAIDGEMSSAWKQKRAFHISRKSDDIWIRFGSNRAHSRYDVADFFSCLVAPAGKRTNCKRSIDKLDEVAVCLWMRYIYIACRSVWYNFVVNGLLIIIGKWWVYCFCCCIVVCFAYIIKNISYIKCILNYNF